MQHTRSTPETLTAAETARLLAETARSADDARDHLLFSMALGTGLRISELCALNVGDVKNGKGAKGLVELRAETTKRHKGGTIALPERLRRKVASFFAWKAERGESLAPNAPLFCSQHRALAGARLSSNGARDIFGRWQARLGFDRHVNFHMLRHTFATNLVRSNPRGGLRTVQLALRHSSSASTEVYTHPSTDDLLEAVQRVPC